MSRDPRLSEKGIKQIEAGFKNDREAHELLAMIDFEFQSDPASVQCFDLRVVERVRLCVAAQEELNIFN